MAAQPSAEWHETEPVRVVIRSTSDWGRIMFDDLNGTNTNGIRIAAVLSSGWLTAKNPDYTIDAGRNIAWQYQSYNQTVVRYGDQVEFFKGLMNFQYSEAYADLTLDVNESMPQIYVWLMGGGNGTSTFEINSLTTGGTIWRDVIVGNGVTQQVKRVMSPQGFFALGRAGDLTVMAWLAGALVVIITLNFPVPELLARKFRRRRHSSKRSRDRK